MTCPGSLTRALLVTLCRFDDNMALHAKTGPFIPCERRLAKRVLLEIQGHGFPAGFLKQGLWQASSSYSVDTPEYRLTLRNITLNLALIGPEAGI